MFTLQVSQVYHILPHLGKVLLTINPHKLTCFSKTVYECSVENNHWENFSFSQVGQKDNRTVSNSSIPSACIREEYNGSTCRPYLASLQSCIDNRTKMIDGDSITPVDGPIFIASLQDQDHQEDMIMRLLQGITLAQALGFVTVGEECMKQIEPFACLHLFPLISCSNETGNGNGTIYRPSVSQCKSLRDDICRELWSLAVEYGYGDSLPDCSTEQEQPPLDLLEDCQGEVYLAKST